MSERAASGPWSADTRAILEARAIELARPLEEATAREHLEVVQFLRGEETYAIESRWVQEVFLPGIVAALPGVPGQMVGATAWRGGVLVLLDPSTGAQGSRSGAAVLAIGGTRGELGLLVDEPGTIERIPTAELRAPGEGLAAGRAAILGVTGGGVIVLDGGELIRMHMQRSGP